MNSTVCQSNPSVLNTKTVNDVNDDSNIVCVSCCKDVFMLSHEKFIARYALSKRFPGVESSNSVRRPKSKDTKSNNRVLKNTNDKSSSVHVRKVSSSVSIDSNKRETMNSTVCQSNASVLNTNTINAVNDGLNIVGVSCGKYVFMLSYEKCVARYALSRDSSIKRALFTTPIAVKSKNLEATSVVEKSRLGVAKIPTTTNKVSSALSLSADSSQRRTLSNYMKKNCNKPKMEEMVILLVLWIVDSGCSKHMTRNLKLLRNFKEKFMGTIRFGNDHFVAITGYGDYVQGNLTICHNRSIVHTRYYKTPYEMIRGRKPNVQYFHVFGSLCYPTNDRDDLRKMKPKADIGIFIGYSESLRGPNLNCSNFQDSSDEMNEIPSHQDLDNLFGPLYEEYYAPSTSKVSNNSIVNTFDVEDTPSRSLIIVEDKDVAELDGNTIMHAFENPELEEVESSLNYQDPSKIFAKLMKDNFEMSMMGEMKFFLRLQIHQSPRGIFINQSQYTMELLRKHRMEKCDIVMTPMATAKIGADLQDTDLAGCLNDYKGTFGGLHFLGDKLVSWSSKKQDCTAMSTAKVEYEHVKKGTIELYFVGTEYQLADLFTKALPRERFEYLVHKIGMRCMTATELERMAKLSS
ncbi:retrovirus-related pol polyprotein from transposon TNT 1-94 [Tanacetum coccineum]